MTAPLYLTGPELRALRIRAGLTLVGMGRELGIAIAWEPGWYSGYHATVSRVKRLEARGIRSDVRDEGLRARVDALRASLPGKAE
jgi:hypothetical protein